VGVKETGYEGVGATGLGYDNVVGSS